MYYFSKFQGCQRCAWSIGDHCLWWQQGSQIQLPWQGLAGNHQTYLSVRPAGCFTTVKGNIWWAMALPEGQGSEEASKRDGASDPTEHSSRLQPVSYDSICSRIPSGWGLPSSPSSLGRRNIWEQQSLSSSLPHSTSETFLTFICREQIFSQESCSGEGNYCWFRLGQDPSSNEVSGIKEANECTGIPISTIGWNHSIVWLLETIEIHGSKTNPAAGSCVGRACHEVQEPSLLL